LASLKWGRAALAVIAINRGAAASTSQRFRRTERPFRFAEITADIRKMLKIAGQRGETRI
jgi:hypothetical protein